jgi:hypothetical protein
MGMRASLSAASEFGRSAVGRNGLVGPALIATAITLVLASCSASSPFSNASQTASLPPPPNYPATSAGQPAYAAPAAGTAATAGPPAQQDYTDSLPYPKQSLADLFRGSTESQARTQNVPRPPSTYTPSNQSYSQPSAQSAYGSSPPPGVTAAAAPPPANPDPTDSLPYPKQSLFELFSK